MTHYLTNNYHSSIIYLYLYCWAGCLSIGSLLIKTPELELRSLTRPRSPLSSPHLRAAKPCLVRKLQR